MSVAQLRKEYKVARLNREDLHADPMRQFDKWFDEALKAELPEPNAMVLSTVDGQGRPSARAVLLKGVDAAGFRFYTNYHSRKGQEIGQNPNVALTFVWLELERQVRIEGTASKLSREDSEAYFKTRPYKSQVAALASQQSRVLPSREVLEARFEELKLEYPEGQVPLPDTWGGYLVTPCALEFWQGRRSRLHDRFYYTREGNGWHVERLAP